MTHLFDLSLELCHLPLPLQLGLVKGVAKFLVLGFEGRFLFEGTAQVGLRLVEVGS